MQARMAFADGDARNSGAWHDLRVRPGESFGVENPLIQPDDISAALYQDPGLISKFTLGGGNPTLPVNWAIPDHYLAIAAHFGHGAAAVESPAGVWTQKLSVSQTAVTFDDRVNIEIWRDKLRGYLYERCLVSQLQFSVSPRGLLQGQIQCVGNRFTLFGEAIEITATGTPEAPKVNGFYRADLADDIFIEVASVAPASVKVKIGAVATYDGTAIPVTDDEIAILADENDVALGGEGEDVQLVVSDTSGWTVGDEWQVPYRRPQWASSLPVADQLNEVAVRIYIDGVVARLRQAQATSTRPGVLDEAVGGRFTDLIRENGFWTAEWAISRTALQEVGLEDALLHANAISLRMEAPGGLIGATGIHRRLVARSLDCRPTGNTVQIGSADDAEEAYTLTAHPTTDVNYPDALTVELVSEVEDLAA
jgi:hypothetical protein